MRYLSVCSGIEAATVAWHPLGWSPLAFSEIEAFPRAVLKHHWPEVPLHGDFTTIEAADYGRPDLLVGGTPCQSFSVAGLRGGMADERGNLTLEFIKLADRLRPAFIVWENVPGILSDSGGAFQRFLDGLEEIGYIVDVDILDAQFFGVPQRRRRVFVCGQHREDLLKTKTTSSALTIAQCLIETLHAICREGLCKYGSAPGSLASAALSVDGAKRRIRLFEIAEQGASLRLLPHLAEALQRCQRGRGNSDLADGGKEAGGMPAGLWTALKMAGLFTPTEQSLSASLAEPFDLMRSFTTSTAIKTITARQIYICSQAVLNIAGLIARLNHSHPCFWSAASSALIALREFTHYARSTVNDLFGDLERLQPWIDFLRQADELCEFIGDIGIGSFGKVFSVADSLRGHPPPRREAGERTPGAIGARSCLSVGAQDGAAGHLITHSLRAEGFDASEDGTGRGTPLVPVAFGWQNSSSQGGSVSEHVTPSLDKSKTPAVCWQETMPTLCRDPGGPASQDWQQHAAVIAGTAVRRLTPRECERLQGFPEVQKSYKILVCKTLSDHQKTNALAALQCRKLPSSVWNADDGGWTLSVEAAAHHSSTSHQSPAPPVALDVLIDLERLEARLHSAGRSFSLAANAESKSVCPLPIGIGNFARLGALLTHAWGLATQDGKAASQQSIKHSFPLWSGRSIAVGFGRETEERAVDAMSAIATATRLSTSTTLPSGLDTETLHSTLTTLCCCVVHAIAGFIPETTNGASCFVVRLTTTQGYTAVPYRGKPAADGPRYRALGNSMAVPVMRWIGERIAMVSAIERRREIAA